MQKFYQNLDYARFLQNFGCDELSGFKKMVKYAHRHVFEITALFGVSAFDEQEPGDEEGRLRPTANPWAHQIAGDIQAHSYADNAVEFKKIYKGKLLNLWLDEDTKGLFFEAGRDRIESTGKNSGHLDH